MKAYPVTLLFLVYFAEGRKILPLDKNANTAFINMEGGGGTKPVAKNQNQAYPTVSKLVQSVGPAPGKPGTVPALGPSPVKPAQIPAPATPVQAPAPVKPAQVPTPAVPAQKPSQLTPKPVNPAPVAKPVTTPGPGTVKQLVNFYDSQGKASPVRPYSYSQAVKQG